MKSKATPKAADPPKRNVVQVFRRDEAESNDQASARKLTRPEVQAAVVIQQFQGENHEVNALIRELEAQVALMRNGDMGRAETMLMAHAHTLDEIFCSLVRRSHANMMGGYPEACERYMRLALKAQSQCRTTLEALAEIKNPRPVAFVRQANIAHGPQQINNSPPPGNLARGKSEEQSNELSGSGNGLLSDTRATTPPSLTHPGVETLEAVHRSEDG